MQWAVTALDWISTTLAAHPHWAYAILFSGSFLETLVGPGFVLHGELLFLPGGILAGNGTLSPGWVAASCLCGGWLGDTASYWIGRCYGRAFFALGLPLFTTQNYKRGRRFFMRHGDKAVFLARLFGPISWIVPFLSGLCRVPYPRFLVFNAGGVLLGISQFVILGYVVGAHYQQLFSLARRYGLLLGLLCTAAVCALPAWRLWKRSIS